MDVSVSRFIQVARQDLIRGETQAAYRELARPCPCDRCCLFEKCKAERIACKAFVSFVHGRRWAWRSITLRNPTRAMYEVAMGEGLPATAKTCDKSGVSAEERAREWIGREVRGREVVGFERASSGGILLRLHCATCGREATKALSRVVADKVSACRCVAAAERARRQAAECGQVGCVAQREIAQPPNLKAWEIRRAERAARRAANEAADARFMDPEQWKPWTPSCAP